MTELNIDEMQTIKGSGISWGVLGGLGAAVVFIIGLFEGITNPIKCKN